MARGSIFDSDVRPGYRDPNIVGPTAGCILRKDTPGNYSATRIQIIHNSRESTSLKQRIPPFYVQGGNPAYLNGFTIWSTNRVAIYNGSTQADPGGGVGPSFNTVFRNLSDYGFAVRDADGTIFKFLVSDIRDTQEPYLGTLPSIPFSSLSGILSFVLVDVSDPNVDWDKNEFVDIGEPPNAPGRVGSRHDIRGRTTIDLTLVAGRSGSRHLTRGDILDVEILPFIPGRSGSRHDQRGSSSATLQPPVAGRAGSRHNLRASTTLQLSVAGLSGSRHSNRGSSQGAASPGSNGRAGSRHGLRSGVLDVTLLPSVMGRSGSRHASRGASSAVLVSTAGRTGSRHETRGRVSGDLHVHLVLGRVGSRHSIRGSFTGDVLPVVVGRVGSRHSIRGSSQGEGLLLVEGRAGSRFLTRGSVRSELEPVAEGISGSRNETRGLIIGFGSNVDVGNLEIEVPGGRPISLTSRLLDDVDPPSAYQWGVDAGRLIAPSDQPETVWETPPSQSLEQFARVTLDLEYVPRRRRRQSSSDPNTRIRKVIRARILPGDYEPISQLRAHWLLNFVDHDYAVWSGDGELSFQGRTYYGAGQFMRISSAESSLEELSHRVTVQLAAGSDRIRRMFLDDTSIYVVEISWIASIDGGITYFPTGLRYRGRTNSPQYQRELYVVELEPTLSDQHRQRPRRWSDEDQRENFPDDLGMTFVADLVDGTKRQRWPP